ncbi:MAG: endopeptidase La [Planctomycetota bacterium]|jgi:ATP-dependent Lon protease
MGRARAGNSGEKRTDYPALQLLSSVVFPDDVVSVQLPDEEVAAPLLLLEGRASPEVALVFTKPDRPELRRKEDLRPVGVVCRVVQKMQMPGGGLQLVFQGLHRIRVHDLHLEAGIPFVSATVLDPEERDTPATNDRIIEVLDLLGEYLPRDGTYPEDLESIFRMNVRGPGRFADLVTAYIHFPLPVKRDVATAIDVQARLKIVCDALRAELQRFTVESDVHRRVREQMEERQREQYLRHQMRAIRHELGDESCPDEESEELLERMEKLCLPPEARETTEREIRRLRSVSPSSAEYQVIRTYVGWLLDLPWKKRTRDRLDLKRARKILDEDHSGLEKVKERILEHLAVRKLKRDQRGPILCLVGPPGVGKTSLGKAVAKTLGRKFVRMSVGGLRDEAEIKGHRRTYVGAMPGKVMQLMRRAGVRNPVLQIDEIDKMGADHRGDPAAAVLEVLDAECNDSFRDHYLDVGFDLSEVFFLVTANLLETVPHALRDRLEVIRMGGYTLEEKLEIAREHLVPRALDGTGLRPSHLRFTAAGLAQIIASHTREAGLRELERNILKICRKVAKRYVEGDRRHVCVGKRRVRELLGPERYRPDMAGRRPEVGVATGLAWTAFGGSILTIEANRMPGRGKIIVTGQLGDVMRESAQAALSYVRAHCEEFEIEPAAFRRADVHIHFPEGATPKDGPSAGVAIATCLASLFTGRPVRHDLAMTGEITLKGKVLEVGGIKEKLLAAHRAGIRTVLMPKDNLKDLEDLPPEVRRSLDVIGCDEVDTNICEALLDASVRHQGSLDAEEREEPLRAARGSKRARANG